MVITLLLILLAIICIYLGTILGLHIAYNTILKDFSDVFNEATSAFLNSTDKIKESYKSLYADFKKMDEKRDNK